MNFDSTADDGSSLAASLWHKGGFKPRPYKLRDRDVLPVRGLRLQSQSRHHRSRITVALGDAGLERLVECFERRCRRLDLHGPGIFIEPFALAGAGEWNDGRLAREQPGNGKLRGRAALLGG